MSKNILFPRYLFRKKLAICTLKKYLNKMDNFLEIGAGRGDFTNTLLEYTKTGSVIDFSEDAISHLKNKFVDQKLEIIKGNFLNYEFEKKYNLVVAFEILEHIEDDKTALAKINNLLSKDGLFMFSVPAHMKKWGTIDDIAGHYRRYEKKELIKLLNNSGFEIIKFDSYGFPLINITSKFRNNLISDDKASIKKYEDKETQTKSSGMGHEKYLKFKKLTIIIVALLFSERLMSLYVKLLKPLNRYDLGDGYLCLVKKT